MRRLPLTRRQRLLKRIELPTRSEDWYYADQAEQKRKAERRMANFDEYEPELRAVVNGCGDISAAHAFIRKGIRTTKAAEDLRAFIGLQQAEKGRSRDLIVAMRNADGDVDTRTTRERAEAAIARNRYPPPKAEPTVDQETARERALRVLLAARGG